MLEYVCKDGKIKLDKEKSKIYFKLVENIINDIGDTNTIKIKELKKRSEKNK